MLRIKMVGRETVFERDVKPRDVAECIAGHIAQFGRETIKVGTDATGKPIMQQREIPPTEFVFEWVENAGLPTETAVLLGLDGKPPPPPPEPEPIIEPEPVT